MDLKIEEDKFHTMIYVPEEYKEKVLVLWEKYDRDSPLSRFKFWSFSEQIIPNLKEKSDWTLNTELHTSPFFIRCKLHD